MEKELICRVCLSRTTKCMSVFTATNICDTNVMLSNMIMACAPVEISEGDDLPTKICDACLRQLQLSFQFRIRILQVDKTLRQCLKENVVPPLKCIDEITLEPISIPENLNESNYEDHIVSVDKAKSSIEKTKNPLEKVSVQTQTIKLPAKKFDEIIEIDTEPKHYENVPHERVNAIPNSIASTSNMQTTNVATKNMVTTNMATNVRATNVPTTSCPPVELSSIIPPTVNVNNSLIPGPMLVPEFSEEIVLPATNFYMPGTSNTLPPFHYLHSNTLPPNYPAGIENTMENNTIELPHQSFVQNSEPIIPNEYRRAYILIPVNNNANIQNNVKTQVHTVSNNIGTVTKNSNSLVLTENENSILNASCSAAKIETNKSRSSNTEKRVTNVANTIVKNSNISVRIDDDSGNNVEKIINTDSNMCIKNIGNKSSENGRIDPNICLNLKKNIGSKYKIIKCYGNRKQRGDSNILNAVPIKRMRKQVYFKLNPTDSVINTVSNTDTNLPNTQVPTTSYISADKIDKNIIIIDD